jgi:hypothetical protein
MRALRRPSLPPFRLGHSLKNVRSPANMLTSTEE